MLIYFLNVGEKQRVSGESQRKEEIKKGKNLPKEWGKGLSSRVVKPMHTYPSDLDPPRRKEGKKETCTPQKLIFIIIILSSHRIKGEIFIWEHPGGNRGDKHNKKTLF